MKAQLISIITSFVAGGGFVRWLVYFSRALPSLPANAGWWKQLGYNLVKNGSGLDPSATIIDPQPKQ